jgi:CheY-like chemotaxis protein
VAISARRTKILIIEDDRDVVDALCDLLQMEGYDVEYALNGQEGLEVLRRSAPPALILLDLMMPVKDGVQFREEQVADRELAAIPVVVMSAHPRGEKMTQAIGARAFLRKPVELEEILRIIVNVAGGHA